MTLILDAGGVSALAGQRAKLVELRSHGQWPPQLPAIILAETLTGDHRRDYEVNKLLRMCQIRPVDELLARSAARLRTATGRAGSISAADAVVAAFAESVTQAVVLTSDSDDLRALLNSASLSIRIVSV
ncbi:MAG: PIN domain-containing protein [Candidatus Dormibacteraceae bacterium]